MTRSFSTAITIDGAGRPAIAYDRDANGTFLATRTSGSWIHRRLSSAATETQIDAATDAKRDAQIIERLSRLATVARIEPGSRS